MKSLNAALVLASLAAFTSHAQGAGTGPPPRSLNATDDALDMYADLTGRTILRPGLLTQLPAPLASRIPTNKDEAVKFIEGELAKVGIEVVQDGQQFARALPTGWANSHLGTQLAHFHPPSPQGSEVPRGVIDFRNANTEQVLEIYSELRERTILRAAFLRGSPISFHNQQPLSKEETIYAMNVLLALNGVAIVDDGDKFVQVVAPDAWSRVRANAPKAEIGATLLDPSKVPQFQFTVRGPVSRTPKKPTVRERLTQFYATCYKKVMGRSPYPPPPNPKADDIVAYYGRLTGYKAQPSKRFGQQLVVLRVRNPVTKSELLYAIETCLALNGLTIVLDDNNSIRVGNISELNEENLRRIRQGPASGRALSIALSAAGLAVLLLVLWLMRQFYRPRRELPAKEIPPPGGH